MNFRERNSPALSVCSEPTTRTGAAELELACALIDEMNARILSGSLRLGLQEVHKLEPGVVVHEHESVLVPAEERGDEGTDDVGVHEPSGMRRMVLRVSVRVSSRIGLGANGASQRARGGDMFRSVGGSLAKAPQVI